MLRKSSFLPVTYFCLRNKGHLKVLNDSTLMLSKSDWPFEIIQSLQRSPVSRTNLTVLCLCVLLEDYTNTVLDAT